MLRKFVFICNVSIVIIMTDTNSSKELNAGGYAYSKFKDEYGKWSIEYKITQSVLTFIELI